MHPSDGEAVILECLHSGWLPLDETLPWTINGVEVSPATRTRREEYHWAAGWCFGNNILDAATGYVDTWHMLPEILTRKQPLRRVVGIDMNPATLLMPKSQPVLRMLGNLCSLPFAAAAFDTVYCISTLEHLTPPEVRAAASELLRVCKWRLVLTADHANWLPELFGFGIGDKLPEQGMLNPPVYAMVLDIVER